MNLIDQIVDRHLERMYCEIDEEKRAISDGDVAKALENWDLAEGWHSYISGGEW